MTDYQWKRFWHKYEETPHINDGLDGGSMRTSVFLMKRSPCLVLLGEPGMGNSIELKKSDRLLV